MKTIKNSKRGVYKLTCNSCNKFYIGRTKRNFKTRFNEHRRDFATSTGKSTFSEHILNTANGKDYDDPTLRERPKENQRSRRVGNHESNLFRSHAQHSPQHQLPLPNTTFSSGPDGGMLGEQLTMPLGW